MAGADPIAVEDVSLPHWSRRR